MIQPLFIFSDWGLLFLRLALALVLIMPSLPEIKNFSFQEKGRKVFIKRLGQIFLGILLLVGFFTQVVAFLVALKFLVILLRQKAKQKFAASELEFLILAAALALLTLGGGAFSLDHRWHIYLY